MPRDQIAAQGYDLSINRNKEIVHADVEHRSPIEILDELDKVEDEIRAGIAGAPSHAGGVAMSSWPTVLLGELCEVVIGRTPSRAHAEYWGLGRPWLSIADTNPGPGNLDHKGDHHRPGSEGVGIAAYPTKHGPNGFKLSIGKTAVSRIPIYTNEAIAALPIRDSNTLEVGYLIRALAFSDLSLRHNRAAMGATLNKAALLSLPVPLPPVSEQRRIAAILDNADALRTKRRDAGARLDDFATSAFNEAFGDLPLEPLGPRLSFVTSGGRGWAKFYTNNGRPFIRSLDVRMNSISTDGLAHVSPPQNGAPAHRR